MEKINGASRGRVCYQQSLPRLVPYQIDFFQKTDCLSLVLLYMWVEYELVWTCFRAQPGKFTFFILFCHFNSHCEL